MAWDESQLLEPDDTKHYEELLIIIALSLYLHCLWLPCVVRPVECRGPSDSSFAEDMQLLVLLVWIAWVQYFPNFPRQDSGPFWDICLAIRLSVWWSSRLDCKQLLFRVGQCWTVVYCPKWDFSITSAQVGASGLCVWDSNFRTGSGVFEVVRMWFARIQLLHWVIHCTGGRLALPSTSSPVGR